MKRFSSLAAVLCLAAAWPVHAVWLGQLDTFSGSLDGWSAGGGPLGAVPPTPPLLVATGGPEGAGDAFMQITSHGGSGPGSRLVVMNVLGQWSGDYLAAGISAIAMDLHNLGSTDLTLRLYFEDPIPGPPQNEAISQHGIVLPVGSGWQHVQFAIGPTDLALLNGSVDAALSGTRVLRLVHSTAAGFPPEAIAAVLGIDNIQAIGSIQAVSEPASSALVLMGLLGAGAACRKRARQRLEASSPICTRQRYDGYSGPG